MTRAVGVPGRRSWWWVTVPVLALSVLYLWPLIRIGRLAVDGIGGRPGLSAATVGDLAGDDRLRRVVSFTVVETVGSVAVAVVVGVAVAWCMARWRWPGRGFLAVAVVVPFVLPSVVVGGAVRAAAGEADLPPLILVVVAHVIFNLGVVVRPVTAAFETIGRPLEDAARVSGRTGRLVVVGVAVRAVAPAIASSALLVGVVSLTSFGVVAILGGVSSVNLEVEIWYRTTQLLDMAGAAVLAAVQMGVVVAMVVLTSRIRGGAEHRQAAAPRRRPRGSGQWAAVVATSVVVLAVSVAPMVALVLASLRGPRGWTTAHYVGWASLGAGTTAETDLGLVLGRSLSTAAAALVLAALIAAPTAWFASGRDRSSRWVRAAIVIPLGVSAATLGFGFVAAFSGPTVDLRSTTVIVVMIQAAVIAPFMVRLAVAPLSALHGGWDNAAAVLGADRRRRARTIVWPQLWRPLLAVAGFGFAMALGEFGATTFVARGDRLTAPLLIGRLFGRPGSSSLGHAYSLSVILAGISIAVFVVADVADLVTSRVRRRRRGTVRAVDMVANSAGESLR